MAHRKTAVQALAIITYSLGLPQTGLAQEIDRFDEQCGEYYLLDDPVQIQRELERLLLEEEDNPCIPILVSLLSGLPTATIEVGPAAQGDDAGPQFRPPLYSG